MDTYSCDDGSVGMMGFYNIGCLGVDTFGVADDDVTISLWVLVNIVCIFMVAVFINYFYCKIVYCCMIIGTSL